MRLAKKELSDIHSDWIQELEDNLENDRKISRADRRDKIKIPKDVMRYTLKAYLHKNPLIWGLILKNLKEKANFIISETTLKTRTYEARDRLFEYCQTINKEAAAGKINEFIDNEF